MCGRMCDAAIMVRKNEHEKSLEFVTKMTWETWNRHYCIYLIKIVFNYDKWITELIENFDNINTKTNWF